MRRWTAESIAHLSARVVGWGGDVSANAQQTTARVTKPSKYRNRRTVVDGITFSSALESRCYQWLKLRRAAGEVQWFTMQVPFSLEGGVVYRSDFLAFCRDNKGNGSFEVIDATGRITQAKANKLKQMLARYGIEVKLWSDN